MAADIEFYFDFSSPYAYFASTAIDALARRHGRRVVWRPILLGVVFKATGGAPLTEVPIKGDYARHDFARTARYHGIDFRMPDAFPLPTQMAARAMLWLRASHGEDLAVAFAKAVFRALFVDNVDISQPAQVVTIAQALGVDAGALEQGANSPEIREQLKRDNEQAMQNGVFGSPFMRVDGEGFWGFDRFTQLEAFLAGRERLFAPTNSAEMVEQAQARIRRYTVEEVRAKLDDPNVQLVDVRDVRELEREGVVPGAFHAPRGMLEFWLDPASPYHKPLFAEPREFIFFCAAGWRSALATATAMELGLNQVADIEGGFAAWKAAGAPVAEKAKKA